MSVPPPSGMSGPQGGYPGAPQQMPPPRQGVPAWVWVVGGLVGLVVLCCCGIGFVGGMDNVLRGSGGTEAPGPTVSARESTSPTSLPERVVPPVPPGSTPNTDTSYTLTAEELEEDLFQANQEHGMTRDEVSCTEGIVLVEGRTARCSATHPLTGATGARADVEVAWAQVTRSGDTEQIRWYLTFDIT